MKCILWLRASTIAQEIESSRDELYSFAKKYGYSNDNCILIGTKGASAIKADERYKEEIQNLYSELDKGEVNCVFAWELSRIGRIEEYVIGLKNYLIKNKIQLRINKPNLYLLEDDGSVNSGMELALNLLLTLAKQEMSIKMERMARGKRRIQKDGKFSGAPCLRYGYTADEDGYIRVDEVTGKYVREMFDMYLNGGMSVTQIYKHFNQRGILPDYKDITAGTNKVLRILKCKVYAGFPDRGNKYPAIVTEQMVDKCIRKTGESKTKPKTTGKNIYYCKGAIFCECGYRMIAQRNNVVYVCRRNHNLSVNINVLDFIAWEMAKVCKPYQLRHTSEESRAEYERQGEYHMKCMEQMMTKKVFLNRKHSKATELYIEGKITKEALDEKLTEIAQDARKLDEGITDHLNRFEASERLKNGILSNSFEVDGVRDDELRRKYVCETMKIVVSRLGTGHYRIEVQNLVMANREDWFDYELKGHYITLWHHCKVSGRVLSEEWTDMWPVRFKRL